MLDAKPEKTRVWVRKGLIIQVKEAYHETQGMKASGLVDWALRYVILLERNLPIVSSGGNLKKPERKSMRHSIDFVKMVERGWMEEKREKKALQLPNKHEG